ncbi:aldehyde dehydrogenase family protein [Chryseobacterium koreense]|uniref:Aldehyde dehydrogenase n=2 Tax=root TaxID=1 RepID=A0A0J7IV26_9FLAO|nr:aldehyde dehydrogenase family protein [Chryseobacterium koreense]KMQ70098.1 aldehyde dehydrogenase [Chryseobacterium koreense CCUG 49689]MBB5334409.1 succinate-semialdehyde dehydrogenase/glutarate-semialdehyde dehydrogenase [Chryseobacterium koreense]
MNLQTKLNAAQNSFESWRKTSFSEKQILLTKLAAILDDHSETLGTIITKEMNKPIAQSIAEIQKCALMCRYYAAAENVLQPEKVKTEFRISEIHYIPKGVILGVMPWNFPFWQVLRFAVPAILAGNTVVLKHASICFGSGNRIEQLFLEAGFPKGVFQNLEIGHAEVQKILENPIVRGVSLTGSEKAGAEVAATAGKNIKKSLLELGGSDAFIVLDDADFRNAAESGTKARLQNCGQACNAGKRFIIQKSVEQEFLPIFIEEYKKYVPGNPLDKETLIAGMARPDLADDLEKQYQMALKAGAEIILPLERISPNEFIPGLIKVKEGNPILEEEVFGPLGMVMLAKDDHEALKLANDVKFGLSNSVWTTDEKRQQYFIENLESGTVSINKSSSSDPRLPFGGAKSSGYGVELSLLALKEFVTVKTIVGN